VLSSCIHCRWCQLDLPMCAAFRQKPASQKRPEYGIVMQMRYTRQSQDDRNRRRVQSRSHQLHHCACEEGLFKGYWEKIVSETREKDNASRQRIGHRCCIRSSTGNHSKFDLWDIAQQKGSCWDIATAWTQARLDKTGQTTYLCHLHMPSA